ncbi:hypothetical protein K491DRAFT_250595 [Lophiostoma macrostomum CBS 122681]|uniref:Uncharacterized protein n=1 Tax=Lophiostoma macrostomum CBS 122681 TaxID=1314788 RepID=A0A6A6SKS4_9PLEO|nr:hypothetical protein K491DRAFT_250595 [Lophiostoma macrostomum CBS 122681]
MVRPSQKFRYLEQCSSTKETHDRGVNAMLFRKTTNAIRRRTSCRVGDHSDHEARRDSSWCLKLCSNQRDSETVEPPAQITPISPRSCFTATTPQTPYDHHPDVKIHDWAVPTHKNSETSEGYTNDDVKIDLLSALRDYTDHATQTSEQLGLQPTQEERRESGSPGTVDHVAQVCVDKSLSHAPENGPDANLQAEDPLPGGLSYFTKDHSATQDTRQEGPFDQALYEISPSNHRNGENENNHRAEDVCVDTRKSSKTPIRSLSNPSQQSLQHGSSHSAHTSLPPAPNEPYLGKIAHAHTWSQPAQHPPEPLSPKRAETFASFSNRLGTPLHAPPMRTKSTPPVSMKSFRAFDPNEKFPKLTRVSANIY